MIFSSEFSELDNTGVIEDNDSELPEDGDDSKEVTEEMMDQADEKRSLAMAAFSEGKSPYVTVFSGFLLWLPRTADRLIQSNATS